MWIRSQDRNGLFTVNSAETLEASSIRYAIIANNDEVDLGTYATKKRALEVLDEIQSAIIQNETVMYEYFLDNSTGKKELEYSYNQKTVYEMPNE